MKSLKTLNNIYSFVTDINDGHKTETGETIMSTKENNLINSF